MSKKMFILKAAKKNIKLFTNIDEKIPVDFITDP